MKSINNYISEKLVINKNTGNKHYNYVPKDKRELFNIIKQRIKDEGTECNLNDIDVSKITDMSNLFIYSEFNGDISEWDVSNVENMEEMFYFSNFNGDISEWDVSNVIDMDSMFSRSTFRQDISKWKINKNCNIDCIFNLCPLSGKEYKWWNRTK